MKLAKNCFARTAQDVDVILIFTGVYKLKPFKLKAGRCVAANLLMRVRQKVNGPKDLHHSIDAGLDSDAQISISALHFPSAAVYKDLMPVHLNKMRVQCHNQSS